MKGNKKLWSVVRLLLSLGLLAWLIGRIGPQTVLATLREVDLRWFAAAFFFFQLNLLIRSFRWYLLLSALDDRPPFRQLVYYYYLGFFFNNFIPSGLGGDVIKVVGLRQEYKQGTVALSSVLMDRIVGLLGSSLIALVALTWSAASGMLAQVALPPLFIITILLVSLAVPAALLLFRLADPLGWLAGRFPWSAKLTAHPQLTRLANTVKQYPAGAIYNSFLSSLPFTLALILTQFSLARGLQVDLPFSVFALFVPIISLVNLLPISFNGLGTREGIYLLLFTPLGIAADRVIAMALLLYIVRVLTGLVGGLLFLLKSLGNLPTRHGHKTT